MTVLIIDDNENISESLKLRIESGVNRAVVHMHSDFKTAFNEVERLMPDVIVLDIFEGPENEDGNPGDDVFLQVWARHFCPLIFYSALIQQQHEDWAKHDFIRCCRKAMKSESEIVGILNDFQPHIETLRAVRLEAVTSIGRSLRDVCSVIWSESDDDDERNELIGRIVRRRVAAFMDGAETGEKKLNPWEQYVYPPICPNLLTGDILKSSSSTNSADPSDYRVVLSPSCDLAHGKIDNVLVACCEKADSFLKAIELDGAAKPKLVKSLPKHLTADQKGGVICLPNLQGKIPLMAVDLKKLELIPLKDIDPQHDTSSGKFHRVASVDSPFRERISFAFAQISTRPGLPDTDYSKMAESIADNASHLTTTTGGGNAQGS